MIEKFQYYIDNDLVRKEFPNKSEAKSLIDKATARHKYVSSQMITAETSQFIFEDIYETIREAAQALMEMKGYKPYSHEAVISFLIEFFKFQTHETSELNRYRILRNKSVYGDAKISPEVCKAALKFSDEFLPKLKSEFEKLAK